MVEYQILWEKDDIICFGWDFYVWNIEKQEKEQIIILNQFTKVITVDLEIESISEIILGTKDIPTYGNNIGYYDTRNSYKEMYLETRNQKVSYYIEDYRLSCNQKLLTETIDKKTSHLNGIIFC